MKKGPRNNPKKKPSAVSPKRILPWVRDEPAREWIYTVLGKESPNLVLAWAAGEPSEEMVKSLPPLIAEVGVDRIIRLSKVYMSERIAWGNRMFEITGNELNLLESGILKLADETFLKIMLKEALKNNTHWFMRLGKVLARIQNTKKDTKQMVDAFFGNFTKSARYLCLLWFYCGRGNVPLCYFTDQSMVDYLNYATDASWSLDNLRKWRQRLGLLRPDKAPLLKIKVAPEGFKKCETPMNETGSHATADYLNNIHEMVTPQLASHISRWRAKRTSKVKG
jgi:hypothetical protein